MKFFIAIILLGLAVQTQAFDPITIDAIDESIFVYDFNHLAYCDGLTDNVEFTEGPFNNGYRALVSNSDGIEIYDKGDLIFHSGQYWSFQVKLDVPDTYELQLIYLALLYNTQTGDSVDIGIQNYEGAWNFFYYYVNNEHNVSVYVNQEVPYSVNLESGQWVSFVILKNTSHDGKFTMYLNGQELYADYHFPYPIHDSYDYFWFNVVYPSPQENDAEVDIMYYVYGIETDLEHQCFQSDVQEHFNFLGQTANFRTHSKHHENQEDHLYMMQHSHQKRHHSSGKAHHAKRNSRR